MACLGPSVERWARELAVPPRPVVFGTVHFALWESQTWLKFICPVPLPDFGIVFRPLDDPAVDAYVKRSRERFGMRLLSRRGGFAEALRILRGRGCVGVLMDQNAGMNGALTTLFGRIGSSTELPGVLAVKFGADVRTFYPRRTDFWRVAFESDPIEHDGTAGGITLSLNRWLESSLARDDELCASWLWAHDRWRHQDEPQRRFRLDSKRSLLDSERRARGGAELPKKLRLWVRMPNWLGDIVLALPLLRALRIGRPDAELVLLAHARFLPLLAAMGVGDRLEALPARGPGYFAHFGKLRAAYPDIWLLLTQSWRSDLEAWLAGAPQRFGIERRGRKRPLLTHVYRVPPDFDESRHHQFELWKNFFGHFGLEVPPDLSAIESSRFREKSAESPISHEIGYSPRTGGPPVPTLIGLIPGSENNPEKRWPIEHWRRLILALPGRNFAIFGTAGDAPIAAAVAEGAPSDLVENLAGRTDLSVLMDRLRGCRLLVTNDTGGMHLANALGVPVIALFGPTNPVRTGPIFAAPRLILQPPGCPPTGGASLAALPPEAVLAAIAEIEASPASCRS